MIKKMILGLLTTSVVFASSLSKDAKDAGLVAIPNDKASLLKLIDDKRNPITAEKTELGKMLYFEPRLSKSGLISCNTCHNLATYSGIETTVSTTCLVVAAISGAAKIGPCA